jgi:phage FluMu protein Com
MVEMETIWYETDRHVLYQCPKCKTIKYDVSWKDHECECPKYTKGD